MRLARQDGEATQSLDFQQRAGVGTKGTARGLRGFDPARQCGDGVEMLGWGLAFHADVRAVFKLEPSAQAIVRVFLAVEGIARVEQLVATVASRRVVLGVPGHRRASLVVRAVITVV